MFRVMDIIVLSIAALAALASSSPPALSSAFGAAPIHASTLAGAPSTAQRSPGAMAVATVTVRIISDSARIGPGAPPLPDMTPRASTIAAADGSQVAALIYDFE